MSLYGVPCSSWNLKNITIVLIFINLLVFGLQMHIYYIF